MLTTTAQIITAARPNTEKLVILQTQTYCTSELFEHKPKTRSVQSILLVKIHKTTQKWAD